MMIKKKSQFPQIKDSENIDKNQSKLKTKTIPYSHSQSIQEEEEHSSLSQININGHSKPKFLMTFPQQPKDFQASEDLKAPTIITNLISNKSQEQLPLKQNGRKQNQLQCLDDSSQFSSQFNSMRSILENKKSMQISQDRVKLLVNHVKVKFLNLIHYSKYNDPILTQEYKEISPIKYHYFTTYIFLSTALSNVLSCIFIPITQFFDVSQITRIITLITFGIASLTTCQDLFFQRGPFKMSRGVIKVNYQDKSKKILDALRLFLLSLNTLFDIDNRAKLITVLLMMFFQFIRQVEIFENIYKSTHHFLFIVQLWISIIISFACIYQVSNIDEDPSLQYCITFAISLLTHCSNISIEINDQNSILISFYCQINYVSQIYFNLPKFIIFIFQYFSLKLLYNIKLKVNKGLILLILYNLVLKISLQFLVFLKCIFSTQTIYSNCKQSKIDRHHNQNGQINHNDLSCYTLINHRIRTMTKILEKFTNHR